MRPERGGSLGDRTKRAMVVRLSGLRKPCYFKYLFFCICSDFSDIRDMAGEYNTLI